MARRKQLWWQKYRYRARLMNADPSCAYCRAPLTFQTATLDPAIAQITAIATPAPPSG